MPLEKGSLILVDYTAKVKDTNEVFDTTVEEEAKKANLDLARKYEPRLVSVGEGWVLRGLDEALANSDAGQKINVEISPDKGFGERDPSKVRMIPQRKLGEKADEVGVGDTVELEGREGTVKYVGSGRVQVDFNHRLAGRTLIYDANIIKKLETDDEKIKALVRRRLPLDDGKIKASTSAPTLEVELPEEVYLAEGLQIIKRAIASDIFKFVTAIKNVKFIENYAAPAQASTPPADKDKDKEKEKGQAHDHAHDKQVQQQEASQAEKQVATKKSTAK
jgi:peptidylprolyl isomerase